MLAALKTWREILTRRSRTETLTPQINDGILIAPPTAPVTGARGVSLRPLGETSANTDNRIFVLGAPVCNAQALTPLENLCIMHELDQNR